jgi:hypothetical protein
MPVLASAVHHKMAHGHGRIVRRSIWVADAAGLNIPHATRIARIRRDRYDIDGALINKEIVHAITSLSEARASTAGLARIARGQLGIESVHWISRHRIRRGREHRIRRQRPPGNGHNADSPSACSISPASPRSPAPSRPSDGEPHAQLPTDMTPASQMTLAIPWRIVKLQGWGVQALWV